MNMMLEIDEIKFATFEKCLDFICNKGMTPLIGVNSFDIGYRGIVSPVDEVTGLINLSISGPAVRNFHMDEQGLAFNCTQQGLKIEAFVPMTALAYILAVEDPKVFQGFPYSKSTKETLEEEVEAETAVKVKVKATPKPTKGGFQPRIVPKTTTGDSYADH